MVRGMLPIASFAALALALSGCAHDRAVSAAAGSVANEALATGSPVHWSAEVPTNWNGTLLLFSRGYSRNAEGPVAAPEEYRAALLDEGYAVAASDYGTGGWALEQAVPAQRATIDAFAGRFGKPARVIGLGHSMGGLVTTALAEQASPAIDAGLAVCSSIGGSLGMMNMALDGAFVFRTLIAPDAGIALVGTGDDMANASKVKAALDAAMQTPQGRARVALAAIVAGLPDWSDPDAPPPQGADQIVQQLAGNVVRGIFLPRADQEARAGGAFSWNEGIDYDALLTGTGRRDTVEALYGKAGLSLADDLAVLAKTPRIRANPQAVEYMRAHYTPFARPTVPLLALQAEGDGLTSPSLQRAYAEAAPADMMQSVFVHRAGHCRMSGAEILAGLKMLEGRMKSGRWPARSAPFTDFTPAPMARSCFRGQACD